MSNFERATQHYNYATDGEKVTLTHGGHDFSVPVAELSDGWKIVPMNENEKSFKTGDAFATACRYVNAVVNSARAENVLLRASKQADAARLIIDNPATIGEKLELARDRYNRALTAVASVLYAVTNGIHSADYTFTPDQPYSTHDAFILGCMGSFVQKAPASLDVSALYNTFVLHGAGTKKASSASARKDALNGFLRAVELMDGAGESSIFHPLKTLANAQDVALFEAVRAHGLRQNRTSGAVYIPVTDEVSFSAFVPQWFLYFLQGNSVRKAVNDETFAKTMEKLSADLVGSFVLRTEEVKKTVRRVNANGDEVTVAKKIEA